MAVDVSRRRLFARLRGGPVQLRPPWALSEEAFTERCTQCTECIDACPQKIIVKGHAGYPTIDFTIAGCTFCGACANACNDGCFQANREAQSEPWTQHALVADTCVEAKGVACRMCESACEFNALQFKPMLGGKYQPNIELDRCTGCGACVSQCPVGALSIKSQTTEEALT